MDPMLDDFRAVARKLTYGRAEIPVAGLTADVDAEHWVRHVRDAVRFHDAVEWLRARGTTAFLEIGPDAVLAALVDGFATQRRGRDEAAALLLGVGALASRGFAPDWRAVFAGTGARSVDLPTYAFQREHYWLHSGTVPSGDPASIGQSRADHPLLGAAIGRADGEGSLLTGRLSLRTHPWLA
ncbi:hypothetical protein RB625_35375, partial [Streptomyces californicus]